MTYNFCTLFDSAYLHKGLGVYQSFIDLDLDFQLYVLAFDDQCFDILTNLNLPKLKVISLKEFETPELLAVKPTRNRAEYCWTSTASLIYHCITKYNLPSCTYIDADLMFFNSPKAVFDEIGNSSAAITEHLPNGPEMLEGKYCVQFNYFKNDEDGMKALMWWKDSCIDWCFAKYEDGKFGDQKYLESFENKFQNVKVIQHIGIGVAPWNIHLYNFEDYGKIKYQNRVEDIIFFHYHGTKIEIEDAKISVKLIDSDSDADLEKNIYIPYLKLLGKVYKKYLNKEVTEYVVINRSANSRNYAKMKMYFRHNRLARFFYYKVLKVKYNGYEDEVNK